MPPLTEPVTAETLLARMRLTQNSGEFASHICALRDMGYGVEHLNDKIPSVYRPIPEHAPQIGIVDEIADLLQQYGLFRMPVTVLTLATDAQLAKVSHMVCSSWAKSTVSFHLEPPVPYNVQINPCVSLGAMRHFAYSYAATQGVLPPDKLMDRMVLSQARQFFAYLPHASRHAEGICFDHRGGLVGHVFGSKQMLVDVHFEAASPGKLAGAWG